MTCDHEVTCTIWLAVGGGVRGVLGWRASEVVGELRSQARGLVGHQVNFDQLERRQEPLVK